MTRVTKPGVVGCPQCGANISGIKEARPWKGTVRRRRVCGACGHKWSTVEVVVSDWANAEALLERGRA